MLLIENNTEIRILLDLIELKAKLKKVVECYGEFDFFGGLAKRKLQLIEEKCDLKNNVKIEKFIQGVGKDLSSDFGVLSGSEYAVVFDLVGGYVIEFENFSDNDNGTVSEKIDLDALESIYRISERLNQLKLSDIRTELSQDIYRYNGGRLHRVANLITEQDVMPNCNDSVIQSECQKLLEYCHTIDREIEKQEREE